MSTADTPMTLATFTTLDALGFQVPGKLDIARDPTAPTKLTVGMRLVASWKGQGEDAIPEPPVSQLAEVVPGVGEVVAQALENSDEACRVTRRPKASFVLELDGERLTATVHYVTVSASSKRCQCVVRLVLVGVDPSQLSSLGTAYLGDDLDFVDPQVSLPLADAAK